MLWTDIYEIVDELIEKHSETDPEKILFVDLRKMVIDLDGFKGINDKFVKETLDKIKENNDDQDFFSAIKLCKKKKKRIIFEK